ncbi:MAG: bifunctional hydroxymethylpyrimidine kinase/phosphomethylpyrimidine kinase [Myxococcota bacterium]
MTTGNVMIANEKSRRAQPIVVLWGGLDPGGQAGLAADLQACRYAGASPRVVLTARTSQNDTRFLAAWPVDAAETAAVARGLDLGPAGATSGVAVKTGMLATIANARTCLEFCASSGGPPLVVDPIAHASSGGWMWPGEAEADVLQTLRRSLLPAAAVVTPNWPELAWLAGTPLPVSPQQAEIALRTLPCAAVLKGGHAPEPWLGVDWVWDGRSLEPLAPEANWPGPTRGTGCRFATVLAVGLARGTPLRLAAREAQRAVAAMAADRWASGGQAVDQGL